MWLPPVVYSTGRGSYLFCSAEGITMSFMLSEECPSVTFAMMGAAEVMFDVQNATCILDIHSNLPMNMGRFGLNEIENQGNYSKWVSLQPNQGVAVTGLASCGAVFVANIDFSRIAAGHMSGDAQFVEDWCKKLLTSSPTVTPHFVLWGTGPDGGLKSGGMVLLDYMNKFKIPPVRAPAVAKCSQIFLMRSQTGGGIACASRTAIPFQREGQAIQKR